jgi:hypothetical protein
LNRLSPLERLQWAAKSPYSVISNILDSQSKDFRRKPEWGHHFMTYESLLKKLKDSYIEWSGIDATTQKHTTETRDFRTLTVWHNKDGYKICVRWAGINCDCSSLYRASLSDAYDSMLRSFIEEYKDWRLQFYCCARKQINKKPRVRT